MKNIRILLVGTLLLLAIITYGQNAMISINSEDHQIEFSHIRSKEISFDLKKEILLPEIKSSFYDNKKFAFTLLDRSSDYLYLFSGIISNADKLTLDIDGIVLNRFRKIEKVDFIDDQVLLVYYDMKNLSSLEERMLNKNSDKFSIFRIVDQGIEEYKYSNLIYFRYKKNNNEK